MSPYLCAIAGFVLLAVQGWIRKIWNFSLVDFLLLALLLCNAKGMAEYGTLAWAVSFALVYLLSKWCAVSHRTYRMGYLLTGVGLLQVLLMVLQATGLFPVADGPYPITGSLDNPGLLGGCLAISFVSTVANGRCMNKYLYGGFLTILGGGLLVSDSRASWLAVLVAVLYMGMRKFRLGMVNRMLAGTMFVSAFALFSLFVYKTDSAKGRLFIWKVAAESACTWTGHGTGSFRSDYMLLQSDYIHSHPLEKECEKRLSNNGFAFNEYLRVLYEQGVVGLAFVLFALVLLFREGRHDELLLSVLLAYAVFACFSYPTESLLLFLCAALPAGGLSGGKQVCRWETGTVWRKAIIVGVCVCGIVCTSIQCAKTVRLDSALNRFLYEDDTDGLKYIEHHKDDANRRPAFSLRYARVLHLKGDYERAIPAIEEAIRLYPTTDKYCDLGEAYLSMDNYAQAEQAYLNATRLLPSLAYPRHCLFLLYRKTGHGVKARETAIGILNLPPQPDNLLYRAIKEEVSNCLR